MAAALVLVAVVVVVLFLLAVFPPRGPHWWRHLTRPLRRRLRPGHYRSW
jgi:hypothetical protein